jgi:ABC-type antimicrobial peptide transport system permease subunit
MGWESLIVGLLTGGTGLLVGAVSSVAVAPFVSRLVLDQGQRTATPVVLLAGLFVTVVTTTVAGSWMGSRSALTRDPYLVARSET